MEIYPASVLGKERERPSYEGRSHPREPGLHRRAEPDIPAGDPAEHSLHFTRTTEWSQLCSRATSSIGCLEDMEKKTGLKSINVFELGGLSCFTNNVRPIRTPADMKGIKFRAMDDSQVAMFRALGANAVPMARSETYTGL